MMTETQAEYDLDAGVFCFFVSIIRRAVGYNETKAAFSQKLHFIMKFSTIVLRFIYGYISI